MARSPLRVIHRERRCTENSGVWRPCALEEDGMEWKPKLAILIALLVVVASLMGSLGWFLSFSLGW
jgi:hypothetical protein